MSTAQQLYSKLANNGQSHYWLAISWLCLHNLKQQLHLYTLSRHYWDIKDSTGFIHTWRTCGNDYNFHPSFTLIRTTPFKCYWQLKHRLVWTHLKSNTCRHAVCAYIHIYVYILCVFPACLSSMGLRQREDRMTGCSAVKSIKSKWRTASQLSVTFDQTSRWKCGFSHNFHVTQ